MKLTKVGKDIDFVLPGIDIEITRVDESIRVVEFSKDGKLLARISKEDYYEMQITVPAPPKMVTKYRLTGTITFLKLPFLVDFDSREEAEETLHQAKDNNGDGQIEEIQVDAA